MTQDSLPEILHLGAENGVTGSCHLLRTHGLTIMVDCGLVQGNDAALPMDQWPVKAAEVDYLFLTHAHADHIGRIPDLIQGGFRGEIIATHPTKALMMPMMRDAMSFADMTEAEMAGLTQAIDELSWGFEYGQSFDLKNGIRFMLRRAGHILGSCFIRFESSDPPWSIIFSGDIGARDKPILPDPDPPDPCDLLILESTYGDTIHEQRQYRIERLGGILSRALADKGKVFIPSFALGRTQELIYEMDRLASDPELRQAFPVMDPEARIPVCLDSPLGLEITKIYAALNRYWDKEAKQILRSGDNPLDFDQLYAAVKYEDHLKLLEMPGPVVIIAGSGMCTGGRIIDHLKSGIEDPRNDIVFVGYQAEGTLGREIISYSQKPDGYVYLDGERFTIKAKVHILSGYSAHADQSGLIEWVESMPEKPGRIKLVHGDPPARRALAYRLLEKGYQVT